MNRELLPDAANRDPGAKDEAAETGAAHGRTVILSGLRAAGYESFLRFSNLGNVAGTAEVTIFDAASGEEVATWESASIPGHGALQISLDDIAGDADIDDADSFVAAVRGGFKGQVQHVAAFTTDATIGNLTSCRRLETPNKALGYIAGPGAADLDGVVQIVNEGSEARSVDLVLHDAATGAVLGSWTSGDVAGHGAVEISTAALAAAATAPVPTGTAALTISVEGSAAHVSLSYAEGLKGGAVTDLTAGCALRGGGSEDADGDDDDDAEDDEGDEDDDSED